MTWISIIQKLLFGVLVSSIIGYNRETKSSPAGLRTYNLVCLGSVILTMVAQELAAENVAAVLNNEQLKGVLTADSTKIIAQIISGIGFLGAGTIIVTQKRIKGLSTASSLWATSAIGIAVGMGYFLLASLSSILVVIILATFNKIIPFNTVKKIAIIFTDKNTDESIKEYFKKHSIDIRHIEAQFKISNGIRQYINIYTIKPHSPFEEHLIVQEIAEIDCVMGIEMLDV
ncbi:MgtC/SapB family protein [Enterococcus sp. LJL99]